MSISQPSTASAAVGKAGRPAPTWQAPAWFAACALIVAGAAALRLAGIFNDFWIDEIWTWMFLQEMTSPLGVFTEVAHDNNHWLNTLYFYGLGVEQPWYVYRLLAVATGTGAVVVAGLIGRRYGRWESVLALVLVGYSYLFVHFSSEARGYAPLTFFALLCFYLMQRQAVLPSAVRAALFSVGCVLGVLSHLTFLYVLAALLPWSLVVFFRQRRSWAGAAVLFLAHYALPLAALVALYVVNLRRMLIGGGAARPLSEVLQQAVAWTLGAADVRWAAVLVGLVALLAVVYELWRTGGQYEMEWIFFVLIFALPALPLFARIRPDLHARYFLASVPFVLIVLSRFLAHCLRGGVLARCAGVVLLLGFLVGNAQHTAAFLQHGRGQYAAALAYLVEHTSGPLLTVGGDHDFRIPLVLKFYWLQANHAKEIRYVRQEHWSRGEPEWVVYHGFANGPPMPQTSVGSNRVRYVLQAIFPHAGASGWNWYLYRAERG